jgi:hypothetical protein
MAQPGDQFLVIDTTGIASDSHVPADVDFDHTLWLLDRIPDLMLDESMLVLVRKENSNTALVPDRRLAELLVHWDEKSVQALERANVHLYRATHVLL